MIEPNSKAFFTLAWDFDPINFPTWGFNTKGAANTFIGRYNAGDWLVIVATQSEPTDPESQGRILGMLQVSSGSKVYDLDAIVKKLNTPTTSMMLDENGVFKWPHGFLITRAVKFDVPPVFSDLFPDYPRNGRQEAANAVLMPDELWNVIQELPFTEVGLPDLPELQNARNFEQNKIESDQWRAWAKAAHRSSSDHDLSAPHDVYMFAQPGLGVKVGYSNDVDRRLKEINDYHRLDEKYFEPFIAHTVANAREAELLEEMMKRAFNETGTGVGSECYRIKVAKKAQSIWNSVIVDWFQRPSSKSQ